MIPTLIYISLVSLADGATYQQDNVEYLVSPIDDHQTMGTLELIEACF